MTFWRNPEIRRQLLFYLLLSALLLMITWFACGWAAAAVPWQLRQRIRLLILLFTGAALAAAGLFHFLSTRKRYRSLARLSEQLDLILHGRSVPFFDCQEGELSILQDEIYKMTITLRQQAESLKGEKQYLCEAITDISHQLRTPLTSLGLIQTMLTADDLTAARRRELTRQFAGLLRRIDDLLTALLKMARIDAGAVTFARSPVNMLELARQAAAPLRIPLELRTQELCFHGDSRASFDGDMDWTAEAVGNILKNCMEHTPPGGRIDMFWEENALYTELRIEDDGPGIAPEDLPHVLERFYKGKNTEGFGVGLAFAQTVTAAQNGVLTASNRPQGGARFVMRFYKSIV